MKRFIFLLCTLCPLFGYAQLMGFESLTPPIAGDFIVDSGNMCLYQENNDVVIGDTVCFANTQLGFTKGASEWAIQVDAATTPSTNGTFKVTHVAGGPSSNVNEYVVNQNGYPSTTLSNNFYILSGHSAGDLAALNLYLVDTTGNTGGQASVINVQKLGGGSSLVAGIFAGADVYPVVAAAGSPPAAAEQGWIETTGPSYADSTTAFGSDSTDVTIFNAQDDYIYLGNSTTWFEIAVVLDTVSSDNINAIFEYSNGAGWTSFSPNDGTAGFTRSGNITFNKDALVTAGWTTQSVNGVSKYYIRIQRTRAAIATAPIEDTIIISDGIQNQWDPEGKIGVQQIETFGSGQNDLAGRIHMTGVVTSHETCDATNVGLFEMYDNSANKISLCICEKTGAGSYAWGPATSGGSC